MALFERQRGSRPLLIGVVHLRPLPGSPGWEGDFEAVRKAAIEDAWAYFQGGVDALILENMHDLPYLRGRVEPETTAGMAIIARAVREALPDLPLGVQLLAGANREALAVALSAQLDFIRVEAFAYAHVADEGLLQACAGELLRTRASLRANHIEILADVQKKHAAHALTADLDLVELAVGTEFCRADGLIVTGARTGAAPLPGALQAVRSATWLPVLIGSGITPENIGGFSSADGLIVGSFCKQDGRWEMPVDVGRVTALKHALQKALRTQ